MRFKVVCLLLVLALSSFRAQSQLPFQEVVDKYRAFLIAQDTTPLDSVLLWSASLQQNGQWTTIDYQDQNASSWKTPEHLGRIVKLSIAYQNPNSKLFKDAKLWDKIISTTNHWIAKRYQNGNWWYNEIGVPQYWRDIVTLNTNTFNVEQRKQALEVLAQYKLKEAFTGANLVWSADLAMHYGLFTQNEALIVKASKLISDEIKISRGEGIRPDYSYHQHGARSQTHHYGASFLKENIRLAYELQNTPWAFPKEKITILKDFLIEGWQWMGRGIYISPATLDRSISRKNFLKQDLTKLLPYLISLYPKGEAAGLAAMLKVEHGGEHQLSGYRYYPYSDVAAYQHKKFSLILKTISTRTEISESINGENRKGTFLNLGNTYLIRNGKEYLDLMPLWDWEQLPGTTNFKGAKSIHRLAFAGGASSGSSGLAVMDFETANAQSKLTGSKFWALHKGQLFCLIAGINLSGGKDSIFTSLDQSRLQGKVLQKNNWVHHNGFTYAALSKTKMNVSQKKVNGAWSNISKSGASDTISENVFKVLLHHNNASSAAYLIDGVTPVNQIQQVLSKPNWRILENTVNCQAIAFNDGTAMLSFHQDGKLEFAKTIVQVNKACVLVITSNAVYISDPLHKGGDLAITLNGKKSVVNIPADGTTIKLNR